MGELTKFAFTMKTIIALACVIVAVSAQRGPFGRGPFDRLKPKCADDSKPTCVCADGTTITRPRPNPCGDRTKPTCTCADGSQPQRKSPCKDGNKPTCEDGNTPVCEDGSAPDSSSLPPCADGPPKCADGGKLSCQDGTPLPSFLANLIG